MSVSGKISCYTTKLQSPGKRRVILGSITLLHLGGVTSTYENLGIKYSHVFDGVPR